MALLNDVVGRMLDENSANITTANDYTADALSTQEQEPEFQNASDYALEQLSIQNPEAYDQAPGTSKQLDRTIDPSQVSDTYYEDKNQYENTGAVGSFLNKIGNFSNDAFGTEFDTTEVIDGKKYMSNNKDFNDESLLDIRTQFNNLKEDPSGDQTLYYMRVQNDDGTYSYKTGVAKAGAVDRYKNQNLNSKTTILYDKRLSDADAMEAKIHGNEKALKYRRNDLGQNRDEFGGGYTELYNFDILGLDGSTSQKKINEVNMATRDKWAELGLDLPTGRYDAKNIALARKAIRKRKELYGEDDIEALRMEGELLQKEGESKGWLSRVGEAADAVQSGTQQLVGGVADFALDVVTPGDNTLLNNFKSAEQANKTWGYDPREADFAMEKSLEQWKNGNYIGAAFNALASPEVLGQSLPEMALMFTPVGAGRTIIGKSLAKVKAAENSGDKVAALRELSKVNKTATLANKAAHQVAKNGGFLAASLKQTNNNVDERVINNNGEAVGLPAIGLMFLTTTALLATDRANFKNIIKGKSLDPIQKMINGLDSVGLNKVVNAVAKNTIKGGEAFGKEFIQEYSQQWGEILSQQLGTEKYGSDVLTEENWDNALKAGIAGGGAGSQIHTAGVAFRQVTNVVTETAAEKAAGIRAKREAEVDAATDETPVDKGFDWTAATPEERTTAVSKSQQFAVDIDTIESPTDADFEEGKNAINVLTDHAEAMMDEGKTDEAIKAMQDIEKIQGLSKTVVDEATVDFAKDDKKTGDDILTTLGSNPDFNQVSDNVLKKLSAEGLGTNTEQSNLIKTSALTTLGSREIERDLKDGIKKIKTKKIKDVLKEILYGKKGEFVGLSTYLDATNIGLSSGKTSQVKKIAERVDNLLGLQKAKKDLGTYKDDKGITRPHTPEFVQALDTAIASLEDGLQHINQSIANYEADVKTYGAKTAKERQAGGTGTEYQAPDVKPKAKRTLEAIDAEMETVLAKGRNQEKTLKEIGEVVLPNEKQREYLKNLPNMILDTQKEYAKLLTEKKNFKAEPEPEVEVEPVDEIITEPTDEKPGVETTPKKTTKKKVAKEVETQPTLDLEGEIETTKPVETDTVQLDKKNEIDRIASLIDSRKLNGKPSKAFAAQKEQARQIAEDAYTAQEAGDIDSAYDLINDIIEGSAKGAKTASTSQVYGTSNNDFESMTYRRTENENDKEMWIPEAGAKNLQSGTRISKSTLNALDYAVKYNIELEANMPKVAQEPVVDTKAEVPLGKTAPNPKTAQPEKATAGQVDAEVSNSKPLNEDFNSELEEDVDQVPEDYVYEPTDEELGKPTEVVIVDRVEKDYTDADYKKYESTGYAGEKIVIQWSANMKGKKSVNKWLPRITPTENPMAMDLVNNFLDADALVFAANELGLTVTDGTLASVATMESHILSFKKALLDSARLTAKPGSNAVFHPMIDSGAVNKPDSNALGFFTLNEDGSYSLDENLANIVFIETMMHIKENSFQLNINLHEDINKILGDPKESTPTPEAIEALTHAGIPRTFFADSLAKRIKRQLPIQLNVADNSKSDPQEIEKLALGFAHLSMEAMSKTGILQPVDLGSGNPLARLKKVILDKNGQPMAPRYQSDSLSQQIDGEGKSGEAKVMFIRLQRTENDVNGRSEVDKDAEIFVDDSVQHSEDIFKLTDVDNEGSSFAFDKNDIKKASYGKEKVSNSPEMATDKQVDSMNALMNGEYTITDAGNLAIELGQDFMKEVLKYVPGVDKNIHKDNRKTVDSQNLRVTNLIKDLSNLDEELAARRQAGKSDGFYYKFVAWKNNRIGMISTKLNAQSDKDARFFIGLKSNNTTVDFTSKEFNEKQKVIAFKTAVVQSLGHMATVNKKGEDKSSWKENEAAFEEIISNPDSIAAIKVLNERERGKPLTEGQKDILAKVLSGKKAHAMIGLVELSKYTPDGQFETQLPMETDAVTSGVMLALLQYPIIENAYQWLNRGGFFFKGQNIRSMGSWLSDANNFDSYQTIALLTGQIYDEKVEAVKAGFFGNPEKLALIDKKLEIIEGLVGKLTTVDEEGVVTVTAEGRKFAKEPLMTFFYGSGIDNIIDSMINNATEKTRTLLEDIHKAEGKERKELVDKYMEMEIAFDSRTTGAANNKLLRDQIRKSVNTNPLEHSTFSLEDRMQSMIRLTYGESLEESMTDIFGNIVSVRKTINETNSLMFDMFQVQLNNKIADYTKLHGFVPDTNELQKILLDLTGVRPRFKTAEGYATMLKEGVSLETYKNNQNVVQTGIQWSEKSPKSISTRNIRREYKINQAGTPVIIIHSLDSSIEMELPIKFQSLQVFDANVFKLDDVFDGTKTYNQVAHDKSKEFSTMESVHEQSQRLMDTFNEMLDAGQFTQTSKELTKLYKSIQANMEHTEAALQMTNEARENMFNSLDFVEHAVMSGEDLGGGIEVENNADFKTDDNYVFNKTLLDLKELNKGITSSINKQKGYIKTKTNSEPSIDLKELSDIFRTKKLFLTHPGIVGYDTLGNVVNNLRHAKYMAFKDQKDAKHYGYSMINRFTGKRKPIGTQQTPQELIKLWQKENLGKKTTEYARGKDNQKNRTPLNPGEMVVVSSKIDVNKNDIIEWDYKPETKSDRGGPDIPVEPSTPTKYKVVGTYSDESITYDVVEVSFNQGNSWKKIRADGKPTIIVRKLGKGIKTNVAVRHSVENSGKTDHEGFTAVETPIERTGRFTTIEQPYVVSADYEAVALKEAVAEQENQPVPEATIANPKQAKPDDNTLKSSEEAGENLQTGPMNKLEAKDILSFAESINTWDQGVDQDTSFWIDVLKKIVVPSIKNTQDLKIAIGSTDGEKNFGNVQYNSDGTANLISLFVSNDQMSKHTPQPRIGQTMLEIYAHEMVHVVSGYIVDQAKASYMDIRRLNSYLNKARENTTYEDFLDRDIDGNIIFTIDKDKEIFEAKRSWNYIFKNKDQQSLEEFIAYGLTNKNFAAKLKTIDMTVDEIQGNSIFDKLSRLIQKLIEKFLPNTRSADKNVDINSALGKMILRINGVNQTKQNFLVKMLQKAAEKGRNADFMLRFKGSDFIANNVVIKAGGSKGKQAMGAVLKAMNTNDPESIMYKNKFLEVLREGSRKAGMFDENGLMWSVFISTYGDGIDTKEFTKAQLRSQERIDKEREGEKAAQIETIKDKFGRELNKDEVAALQLVGLETDLSALLEYQSTTDNFDINTINELLSDPVALQKAVNKYKRMIVTHDQGDQKMVNQAIGLGSVMANGLSNVTGQLMNAHMIARKASQNDAIKFPDGDLEQAIDVLSTLSAIQKTDPSQLRQMAKMIDSDKSAVTFFLNQHTSFKNDSLNTNFDNDKTLTIKGYTVAINNSDIQIKILREIDVNSKSMKNDGFRIEPDSGFTNPITGDKMVIYSSDEGSLGSLNPGAIPRKRTTARGHSLRQSLIEKHNGDFKKARLELKGMIAQTMNGAGSMTKKGNAIIAPVFNRAGEIVDLRVMMNKHDNIRIFHRENNGIKTLGTMRGASVEKANAPEINTMVAQVLKDDFDIHFKNEPTAFVEIGQEVASEEFRIIWNQIPKPMQYELEQQFGRKSFYVRRKALRSIIGEHDASFANVNFFGKDVFDNYPAIRKLVRFVEKWWKKIIALEKVQIVIRTPEVLFTNIISNSIKLMQEGMSIDEVIAVQYEGLIAAIDYIRSDRKLRKLKLRYRAGETALSSEIDSLNAELKRNPISYLVDEGFLQSVVEDVDIRENTYLDPNPNTIENTFTEKYEKYTSTKARQAIEFTRMGKTTSMFKIMLKSTQYSDLVARYALDKIHKKNQAKYKEEQLKVYKDILSGRDLSKEEINKFMNEKAVEIDTTFEENRVIDLANAFIHYGQLDHWALKYANDMGLVMFTKFLLGIQRVIWKMAKEHPTTVIAIIMMQYLVGDAEDPLDSSLFFETDPMSRFKLNPLDHVTTAFEPKSLELFGDFADAMIPD